MLYHNIENCDEERKIKKMIEEEEKNSYSNTFHKKEVKEKVISKVKKKMIEE